MKYLLIGTNEYNQTVYYQGVGQWTYDRKQARGYTRGAVDDMLKIVRRDNPKIRELACVAK